jgi:CPA2 family monovalent cation:H+ antiporter-2
MHDLTLLITLAGGLAFALLFGWLTQRLGLSTLVGYMLAGILVGPHTPGFVADTSLAQQMAEIGVVLLMFGVGMHFHPQELLRVWRLALPGAVGQSLVAAVAGWALARAFGWSHAAGVIFGMALAVASTVVLMRMLVERNRLSSRDGHVAVGWLIVEDLFTVAALVVLPVIASDSSDAQSMGSALLIALAKVAVFALLVGVVGTRVVSRLLERMVRTRSAELFTLAIFVVALGIAVLAAEVFHVSVALGAFFAGLVVGQSRFGAQAAADMAPVRDVFSALFFVSIGMLFNPSFVVDQPLMVVGVLAIVLVLKPLVALITVLALRDTLRTAATVAVGLGQIGEFSFILASLGAAIGVLPPEAMDALVVAAIVSIAVNPLLFRLAEKLLDRPGRAEQPAVEFKSDLPSIATAQGQGPLVVLAGYRGLGRRIAARAAAAGIPLAVIDGDVSEPEQNAAPDVSFVYGNPARAEVLQAAGIGDARMLVIADLPLTEKMQVCTNARRLNPRIAVIGAAANDAERAWLSEIGASFICDALDEQTEQITRAIRANL